MRAHAVKNVHRLYLQNRGKWDLSCDMSSDMSQDMSREMSCYMSGYMSCQ